ncbi:ANKK1 [Branchiostoma lanceolatum]|uniref:ANKK1 protein n=1 Tax=Branchiostoma lanceolatum TaxID=7740 RepID=A0A8K0AES6_BRALA|nr:ANKK1 [Branchiostoma lanceolatum]
MGVVMRIDDDEDVRVIFNNCKKLWCINPAAVQKVGKTDTSIIKEGDLVMIRTDIDRMEELQLDLDEWDEDMKTTIGGIGRVRKITDQGSLSVRVGGRTRNYHAECLKKIKLELSSGSGVCEKGLHYWKQDGAKICTRCVECTDEGTSCSFTGNPLRPPGSPCGCRNKAGGCVDCGLCQTCAGESDDDSDTKDTSRDATDGRELKRLRERYRKKHGGGGDDDDAAAFGMTKGDKVKVDTDAATFRMLQAEGREGWTEDMLQIIGIEGTVTGFRRRAVIVQFPDGAKWSLMPGCLTKTTLGQEEARTCFQKGDLVKVINDERKVKKLQQRHGGYKHDMHATLGKTGCVLKVKKNQVQVVITNKSWWLNPAALIPAKQGGEQMAVTCHLKAGDQVKVTVDAGAFKANQAGHGGFIHRMTKARTFVIQLVGEVGVVHHVDIDGDAVVYYPDGNSWCINPLNLEKLAPGECASVDVSGVLEAGDWVKVESDRRKIKHVQERTVTWDTGYYDAAGKVGQVTSTYPFNVIVRVGIEHRHYPLSLSLLTKATAEDVKEAYGPGNVDNPGVARADLVKIAVDVDKLRMMQNGHGGFVDDMEKVAGSLGSVSYIDKDGDICVRFSLRRLCFNPHALSRVMPVEDTFYVGDIVLIESDQSRFKSMQTDEHGGYNSMMTLTCGQTGRILSIINNKRMKVKVLGKTWMFNPDLLIRMGNPGVGTGDWRSATICAQGKHDWSEGRCLVCITCGECTHYGSLCPARDKPGRFPGSICGCGNGHAGCDDCGTCNRCAGELHDFVPDETDEDDIRQRLKAGGPAEAWLQALLGKLKGADTSDSTKPPHRDQHRGDMVQATPMQEMSGVLKNMRQAIELMRESKGLDSMDSVKNALQIDCVEPFSKYASAADRRLMGDTVAKFDGARVFMDYLQVLSSSLSQERDGQGTGNLPLECMELLRRLLIYCTDNSIEFCRAVGTCGLLGVLVQDLLTFHNRAQSQSTWPMIRSLLAILYNCARTPENREYFCCCGASDALKPYLRIKDVEIRITTLSCLGFIVEKENLHLIRLNEDIAKIIVSLLNEAMANPPHTTSVEGCQYSTLQICTTLSVLVQNDENKQIFVKHGVVDKLIMLMESGDEEEKEHAILCIQKLAYNDHISTVLKEKTRVEEVLTAIKRDKKLSSAIRDVASAALQILQEGPPRVAKDQGPGTISIIKYSDLVTGDVIGEGGFGQVRKAYHREWMVDVAVKKLTCSSRNESVRRSKALLEEAAFMKQAQNAYRFIVCLHGVCIEDQFTALVMEFMANGSVKDLMSRVKPVPWALRWRILHETILGMNFLHSMDPQIIHHDLKVQNVLLDGDFHAKISDFGLAEYKPLTSIGDEKGNLCGTITHIPPEYFKNPDLKAGEKFDVYSFGIFIWEVFTGKRPYQDILSPFIGPHVMGGKRPDKKQIPTEGPKEQHLIFFVDMMEKCWDQDPHKRPKFRELGKQVHEVTKQTNTQVAQEIQLVLAEQGKVGPGD